MAINSFALVQPAWVHDTLMRTLTNPGPEQYIAHNLGARYILRTNDISLPLQFVDKDYANLTIYVNGVFYQQISCLFGSPVRRTVVVSLPAGAKVVEVEENECSLTGIGGAGSSIQLTPYYAPRCRIIMYGTSIEYSMYASFVRLGWVQLLRRMLPSDWGITNISYPGTAAQFDNSTPAASDILVASLAAAVDGRERNIFMNTKMVNDYGGGTWSAASFRTAMAILYGKLRAAYPSMNVLTMAAFIRNSPVEGTVNSYGNNIADYRVAGRGATSDANATAGSVFCYDRDGTDMPALTYTDGLHPDTGGHATIAAKAGPAWFP